MHNRLSFLALLILICLELTAAIQPQRAKKNSYIGETEKNRGSQTSAYASAKAELEHCLSLKAPSSFSSGQNLSVELVARKPSASLGHALSTTPELSVRIVVDPAALLPDAWDGQEFKPKNLRFNGTNKPGFVARDGDLYSLVSFVVPGVRRATPATLNVTVQGCTRSQQVQLLP